MQPAAKFKPRHEQMPGCGRWFRKHPQHGQDRVRLLKAQCWDAVKWTARMLREFHPLRFQRWAFSDLNPWLAWLSPAASAIKTNRQAAKPDHPWREIEQAGPEMISASLDCYRGMRDAATEATFFSTYANLFSLHPADRSRAHESVTPSALESPDLPFVKEALAAIEEGGYTEALARAAALLSRKGEPFLLSRIVTRKELAKAYVDYLPDLPRDQCWRIRGEQEIIASYEPEQALATLPMLLAGKNDRKRLLTLLDELLADERLQSTTPTGEQQAMLDRIRDVLSNNSSRKQPPTALARP